MKGLPLLFYGISFLFNAVQSQETFSIKLSEEVTVVNSLSNDGCFNRTIKATSRNLTSQVYLTSLEYINAVPSLLFLKKRLRRLP